MRLEYFCHLMGFSAAHEEILKRHWQRAVETLPERIAWLAPESIAENAGLMGLDGTLVADLQETAQKILARPELRLYAWLVYHAHFVAFDSSGLASLPELEGALGAKAGLFNLLLAMSSFPLSRATLQRLGIPEEECMAAIARWTRGTIELYRLGHEGRPGQNLQQLYWMSYYVRGTLFGIGRFEYWIHPLPEWLPAIYRHRQTREVLALCRDGWCFDADGQRARDGEGAFTARLAIRDGVVSGTPIAPDGHVLSDRTLDLLETEWEPVVSPWEWTPSIHIPAGGGMTPERVLASLHEAKAFFSRYFHRDIKLFCCCSWILNPAWETMLPQSNLAAFMRTLYKTPGNVPGGKDGLFFVFGKADDDWSDYPRNTSLQRAFHQLREHGVGLCCGAGFVLTDDLDHLEEHYYREHASSLVR